MGAVATGNGQFTGALPAVAARVEGGFGGRAGEYRAEVPGELEGVSDFPSQGSLACGHVPCRRLYLWLRGSRFEVTVDWRKVVDAAGLETLVGRLGVMLEFLRRETPEGL